MLPVSETDFETQVLEAGVNVFFKPTKSHYTFLRLSNDKHVARSAPLSRHATVRHAGPSGDTGEYDAAQVFEIAYKLASMVAKRRDQQG
jgi:hypothetical protein